MLKEYQDYASRPTKSYISGLKNEKFCENQTELLFAFTNRKEEGT